MVNNVKYNDVRYSLYHISIGQVFIDEPIGFNNDDLEYARNDVYSGVFTLFSNNLEFYGDALNYIEDIYQEYGEEAEVVLKKEVLGSGLLWDIEYEGVLDFNTYVYGLKKSTCKFTSSGLASILKTQEDIEIDIERTDALNGNSISQITTNEFEIQKRDILVLSQSVLNGQQILNDTDYDQTPLTVVLASQNDDFSDVNDSIFTGNANNFFWNQNSSASTDIRVDIEIEANALLIPDEEVRDVYFSSAYELHRYNWNGSSYDFVEKFTIGELDKSGIYKTIKGSIDISLNLNDSLALKYVNSNAVSTIRKFDLSVSDVTQYVTSSNSRKFVFIHDLLDKMTSVITGRDNKFSSSYFGRTSLGYAQDGDGALIGLTNGMWIRGFDSRSNLYKPPIISWKDIISSLDAVFNIGLGIQKDGLKDIVVVEDKKYFFQEQVVYTLPNQVSNFQRETDKEMLFSELEFGYSRGGKYEDEMGLDEPNVKSNYSTSITKNKKKYSKLSKVRADAYGKEFARRKSQNNFPTEDTKYDDSNWFLDIKDNTVSYTEKLWEDRFEEEPTGVYSPSTLTGAYFSPANNLLRHSWYFSSGLEKDSDKYIRFSSSSGNSNLSTKLIGGNKLDESGDILNYNLSKSKFKPSIYRFSHYVDKTIRNTLRGKTLVGTKYIPNSYFLWEFKDENNVSRRGYIKSVKPNSGEWELIPLNERTKQGNSSLLEVNGSANIYTYTSLNTNIVDINANVPPIIGVLSIVDINDDEIEIEWTAATDTNLNGYKVYYKLSSDISWTEFSDVGSGVTNQVVTGLSDYTYYDFSIIAYDSGTPVLESERSNVVTERTLDATAPIIGVLSKGTQTDSTFPLTWTAATDNVGVEGYKVYYKETSSGTWIEINTGDTDLFYTVTGLSNGTSYDFKITAYDSSGNESSDSNIITDSTNSTGVVWYSASASASNVTDTDACSSSQPYTYWYTATTLAIGEYVYTTNSLSYPLNGSDLWYKIGDLVLKIDSLGEIIDDYTCHPTE